MTMDDRVKLKITPDVVRKQFHDAMERNKPVMAIEEKQLERMEEYNRERERLIKYFQGIKEGYGEELLKVMGWIRGETE